MEKQDTYRVIKIEVNVETSIKTETEFPNLTEKELLEFWKNNQFIAAGCGNIVCGKECYCQSSFTNEGIITIIQIKN